MKVSTFFSNRLVVILDLTTVDKINLNYLQTSVTANLERENIQGHGW
jgi:hypothetical protein